MGERFRRSFPGCLWRRGGLEDASADGVRVMDDEAFVHAECERAMPGTEDEVAPVGWNGFMSQMLGKVYKIEDVEIEDQSAELAAVPGEKNCWWPYTTLLKVEW